MRQSLGHHRYKMLAHTIHESKHQPQTHLQHNPRKETRRRSSTGVASGNNQRLLPQTPNSAPPGSSRNPGESSILTAIPTEGTSTRRRSPSIGSTFESAGRYRKKADYQRLLRKEVIQPHLPVRLPCYDFVPIASPTFTHSLPQGVGPQVSGVADFHDVTGGVYKARERIHRGIADPRLLATPPSWGRVADPNPN